ncbi:hypothetical protein QCE62_07100 [Caballeronia sp. LZ033]|uniref:hypothetical protein n=1 Tax=Caballeronia sp. LZ033 TaxID=3038566 RepID=UPI00285732CC|nr:hypothetical protein [Caballeronia sp. LZ033]MDR5813359.1 hypothetical protein [Caballeronia sp. LZ033]
MHINIRTEKHGDESVTGVDLRFSLNTTNDALAMFSSTLKSALYMKDDSPQGEIEPDASHLTMLKNPRMGAIKWDEKYDHARVVVHHGASGREDIVFGDAKVNKFVIEPKEGGTVVIGYRVQGNPTEAEIGKLTSVLNQEVQVTVDPEGGDEADDGDTDTGAGANAAAKEVEAQKNPAKRRGRRKQMDLVE